MTPRPPLSDHQLSELRRAQQLVREGKGQGAIERIRPLLEAKVIHADVYWLFAEACRLAGLKAEARTSLNAAINLDPAQPGPWAALGSLLEEMEDLGTALVARRRLVEVDPDGVNAWLALGDLLLRLGDAREAEPAYRRALALVPGGFRAGHGLALALRLQDRAQEALAVTGALVTRPGVPALTRTLHGHLLGDLDRLEDAAAQYRAVIATRPEELDAQETLARLLPQIGQGDEALAGYEAALRARPGDRALWRSAVRTARGLRRWPACLAWSEQAVRRFPGDPFLAVAHADALGFSGDPQAALALLEPLAGGPAPDAFAAVQAAHWRLATGHPEAAERHARAATALAPDEQTGWAYLATAWRLLNDPRERWLIDPERHVGTLMLEPPPGYADRESFLAELRAVLEGMHGASAHHPDDQSARQGTQTRGHLFTRRDPVIEALSRTLHRQIEEWLATLPRDETHPFLRRNTGWIGFRHSWSIRLRDSGFHVSHIHQEGWLSSAFYVSLPPEVEAAPAEGDVPGALVFGVPDGSLGLSLPPRRVERPEVGKLVLFPSYAWHGTIPFASVHPRMTVAFDALPVPAQP